MSDILDDYIPEDRSSEARRARDLVHLFAEEFGGMAALSETGKQLVRRAAQACWRSEMLETAMLRGEPVTSEEFVRLANASMRAITALRHVKRADETNTLEAFLRRHAEGQEP